MYVDGEDRFYYLTVANEPYAMPAMPEGAREGILKGMYKLREAKAENRPLKIQLLGSGVILNEVIKAQEILEGDYGFGTDVWSVTSYKELFQDALHTERRNRMSGSLKDEKPYVAQCFEPEDIVVAASDYTQALPCSLARWMPDNFVTLGTDGFGRSENRESLRDFFEVDERHITLAVLGALARAGAPGIDAGTLKTALKTLKIDPKKANPLIS
jgi:pyruvate dehydrogenase E1 component